LLSAAIVEELELVLVWDFSILKCSEIHELEQKRRDKNIYITRIFLYNLVNMIAEMQSVRMIIKGYVGRFAEWDTQENVVGKTGGITWQGMES
jgi:hypothetical protein